MNLFGKQNPPKKKKMKQAERNKVVWDAAPQQRVKALKWIQSKKKTGRKRKKITGRRKSSTKRW